LGEVGLQTDSAWERLAPLLDDAMAQLRDKDRDAIVLRYFENKCLKEVGAALGIEERAAPKRVGRSLEGYGPSLPNVVSRYQSR